MKRHMYTLIALIVFFGPFVLSFHPWVSFFSRWPAVLASVVMVGGVYILWDVLAVKWGHWHFNDTYVGTSRWLGLPPGEWLFFFVVPYACLFVYEVVVFFLPSWTFGLPVWWWEVIGGILFGVLAWIWRKQGYTCLAIGSVSVFWWLVAIVDPSLVNSGVFWVFMLISMVLFLIVNGLYVNLPTIFYHERAIWGIRFFRIPLEDFFYNFSFLGFSLLVYRLFR